jgi:hypothetical protein
MSDENPDDPIVLHGPGLEELPDGSWELLAEAPTLVHYITMPKWLRIGDKDLCKCGWNSDTKYALYRSGWATSEEAMRHLM